MQKKWYAVYTRPECEKKVKNALNKLKIENYCPLVKVRSTVMSRTRIQMEPLFKSYVFLNISDQEMLRINRIKGIVNFLHWLGKPAIINEDEIEAIRNFTAENEEVKVEKIHVNLHDGIRVFDEPSFRREGKFISIKGISSRIDLPSLGYTLIAGSSGEVIRDREHSLFSTATASLENAPIA